MPRYTYDLFEPSSDNDVSLRRLTEEFAPLHMKAWQKNKEPVFGKAYNMNVGAFATMWLQKYMKIFMAYDDGRPIGYLTGVVYKPLEYPAQIFEIDDWFTNDNTTVRDGLFDHVDNAIRVLGVDEIRISYKDGDVPVDLGPSWKLTTTMKILRYTKR